MTSHRPGLTHDFWAGLGNGLLLAAPLWVIIIVVGVVIWWLVNG